MLKVKDVVGDVVFVFLKKLLSPDNNLSFENYLALKNFINVFNTEVIPIRQSHEQSRSKFEEKDEKTLKDWEKTLEQKVNCKKFKRSILEEVSKLAYVEFDALEKLCEEPKEQPNKNKK